MEIAIRTAQLLLSLSILVVLHELGHFLTARYFGTRVEKFYLFFNPWFSLFKKKIGDTEYGIGWLPLGGYVKISGMIDESMDTEQMALPPQPYEFRSKPAWQRLIIMLGGVIVNFILGFLIYASLLFFNGETVLPSNNVTDGYMITNEFAKGIGFQNGDKILSFDNKEVGYFGELIDQMIFSKSAQVERAGEKVNIEIPEDMLGQLSEKSRQNPFFYPRFPFLVSAIPDSSINAKAGFAVKDTVVAINGQSIRYFDEAGTILKSLKGASAIVSVKRDGGIFDLPVQVSDSGYIEIGYHRVKLSEMAKANLYEFDVKEYGFLASIPAGWNKMTFEVKKYLRGFALIFQPKTGAYKGLGGFAAIAGLFPTVWDWTIFWERTAFISLILAVMNLLPIPALDGGHVMFLLYEMVTGREPNQKFMEYAQMVGIIILLALLLFANGNDLFRFLRG
ncbi:MAG: regulator of sigma E protease [Patiriisocius sp.]|jgi:regulator of sigma E protease